MFVTLRCAGCDNPNCKIGRYIIPDDSLEGCTREVTDEQAAQLTHYIDEVLPFIPMYKNTDVIYQKFDEIYDFLQSIYTCPIGRLLDARGKVIDNPKTSDNRINKKPIG